MSPIVKLTFAGAAVCGGVLFALADDRSSPAPHKTPKKETVQTAKFRTESLRGRVIWLADGLERQLGVKSVPEAKKRALALATDDGRVLPIAEDLRGRSFRTDDRLRNLHVELAVRRYKRSPVLQILKVYEVREDGKFLLDYWCDVCAIVMFEAGPCSCCQDANRLRKRRVDQQGNPLD